jgi:hypothetical protein
VPAERFGRASGALRSGSGQRGAGPCPSAVRRLLSAGGIVKAPSKRAAPPPPHEGSGKLPGRPCASCLPSGRDLPLA